MLFEQRLREGIHDGSITLMFRRWKRPQAVAGGRYRTMLDMIEVLEIDVVDVSDIGDADAGDAGFANAAELIASMRGDPQLPLYRIRLRRLDEPDPREVLAATAALSDAERAAISKRLARLDGHRPWTRVTLEAIAAQPDVVSTELAAQVGMERPDFKLNVRKLKALGLTLSRPVGYRLSARGRAYLDGIEPRP